LKAKIDAGANRAITQFFFEKQIISFLDKVQARGLDIPITPASCRCKVSANGKFRERAGASVPQWLADRFRRARQ